MKKLMITLFLLSSVVLSAQKKVSFSGYIPLITKHYVYNSDYTKNEGGRYGLILTRKVSKDNYFTETSFGALENSFGEFSVVMIQAIGKDVLGISVSAGMGITSGYQILYQYGDKVDNFPKFLKDNGLLPYVGVTLSLSKPIKVTNDVNVSFLIIVTPTFVNSGIKMGLN